MYFCGFQSSAHIAQSFQSPSLRIRWNTTRRDDVIHLWCKLRHGYCRRNRCWVKRSLWQRRGSQHLAAGEEERGRVMGVAGDEQVMFLFPPWQLPNSQGCAALREGVRLPTCALPVILDPYCCARQWPEASMLHVMNYTEQACRREKHPGEEHSAEM